MIAFNHHIGSNVDLSEHHEKLHALLTAVKGINETRQVQDAPAPAAEKDAAFQGEAKLQRQHWKMYFSSMNVHWAL